MWSAFLGSYSWHDNSHTWQSTIGPLGLSKQGQANKNTHTCRHTHAHTVSLLMDMSFWLNLANQRERFLLETIKATLHQEKYSGETQAEMHTDTHTHIHAYKVGLVVARFMVKWMTGRLKAVQKIVAPSWKNYQINNRLTDEEQQFLACGQLALLNCMWCNWIDTNQ